MYQTRHFVWSEKKYHQTKRGKKIRIGNSFIIFKNIDIIQKIRATRSYGLSLKSSCYKRFVKKNLKCKNPKYFELALS